MVKANIRLKKRNGKTRIATPFNMQLRYRLKVTPLLQKEPSGHRCTPSTKLSTDRAAYPLTPGCGAAIVLAKPPSRGLPQRASRGRGRLHDSWRRRSSRRALRSWLLQQSLPGRRSTAASTTQAEVPDCKAGRESARRGFWIWPRREQRWPEQVDQGGGGWALTERPSRSRAIPVSDFTVKYTSCACANCVFCSMQISYFMANFSFQLSEKCKFICH
jgi:hypothetical protein